MGFFFWGGGLFWLLHMLFLDVQKCCLRRFKELIIYTWGGLVCSLTQLMLSANISGGHCILLLSSREDFDFHELSLRLKQKRLEVFHIYV